MKRLVIITVGKTHSGKTTFARALEKRLEDSIVMDQDNHAEFINTHYKKLQPKKGPNTLKHAISKLIVDYTVENTNYHLIISNSNRSINDRLYLLKELFPEDKFTRILVHFDITDKVLMERITSSNRSTNIFRSATNFEQVLLRQNSDSLRKDVIDPKEEEADYLFVIHNKEDVDSVIEEIVHIAKLNVF
ncbi:AAA family ATPase [Ornithinibacillus californiensis]|uniref:AAA family ATPase n=1 Tax=Ornithinibacillus californiensis TaxID=161536 RepID=UPI00064E0FE5|nr:AAA family ATPase [Ornithinibacillus californiensis]